MKIDMTHDEAAAAYTALTNYSRLSANGIDPDNEFWRAVRRATLAVMVAIDPDGGDLLPSDNSPALSHTWKRHHRAV